MFAMTCLIPAGSRACHARGVVVLTVGAWGDVLRFLPPLVSVRSC